MSNPVYFHCVKCNGIDFEKSGTPKHRRYECRKCGTVHTNGHGPKGGNKVKV